MEDDHIAAQLAGTECSYCDDGSLVESTYKGDFAVVCEACDTPAYRSLSVAAD